MKNYVKTIKEHSFLFLILILALALRFYGINWDQGAHLHPDERMLIMVAAKIHFFDQLNPNFFNYGSLPIYLLSGTSQFLDYAFKTHLNNYDGMLYVGRILSVLADTLTVLLIYKIALVLLRDKRIAAFASFFYAVAFFPIQNAHFFVVDVFLNLFAVSLILTLLLYLKKPSLKKVLAISIISALIVTTKFTGVIFLPVVFLVLILPVGKLSLTKQLINSLRNLLLFTIYYLLFTFFFMPYAFIEHKKILSDVMLQTKMSSDPFIFPYTLQYVGTTPYFYYLKNIFLWGLGPIISLIAVMGILIVTAKFVNKVFSDKKFRIMNYELIIKKCISLITNYKLLITFALFYILYFLVIGRSAVKFMRYMLPLYPAFAIMAGYALQKLQITIYDLQLTGDKKGGLSLAKLTILISSLLWSLMFVSIYSRPHTRISASEWIYKNIPEGSTLAVEHWDDRLPLSISLPNDPKLYNAGLYNFVELPLYEFDTQKKWEEIDKKLDEAQYLIIASNRLYTPLIRLVNCTHLPPNRCYPRTSQYYKNLFAGELGFEKAAEFTSYPQLNIPITNYQLLITDDSADESFTVYDHPKIMIFKDVRNEKVN